MDNFMKHGIRKRPYLMGVAKKVMKPKFCLDQEVVEGCGCIHTIDRVTRKYYHFKHLNGIEAIIAKRENRKPRRSEITYERHPIDRYTHKEFKLLDPKKPCPYCKKVHG